MTKIQVIGMNGNSIGTWSFNGRLSRNDAISKLPLYVRKFDKFNSYVISY